MLAAWVTAGVAVVAMISTVIGAMWRGARRDGKIDAVLEQLTAIAGDHETRIRAIEKPRHRAR